MVGLLIFYSSSACSLLGLPGLALLGHEGDLGIVGLDVHHLVVPLVQVLIVL